MRIGDDVANRISSLRNRVNAFLLARLAEEGVEGLAPSHGAVLAALYREGPQPMKALCSRVRRDKSTLTVLARKLEALGYIRREADASDSRVTILCLTEKGIAFQVLFERISDELRRSLWGDTSDQEREEFCRRLSEMAERMERAVAGSRPETNAR